MGLYAKHVLPRMIDKLLGTAEAESTRARVCGGLHGDVVEIGFGSGRSAAHLPAGVTGLWVVEPSATARRLAEPRTASAPVPVEWAGLDGQRLDLPDARFDTALSTWTLCTVPDATAALRELARVLKPGGTLHFVEHGASDEPGVRRWQERLQPINGRVAGGCHLERPIAELITSAGFDMVDLRNYYAKGDPKPFGFRYEGIARRVGPDRAEPGHP
ncbi:MAG TPA: class I SAM-dependent methyltransferase [Mycobacteriales bacterium]|nr:class I SAM-dependent methyltransferase [Mycobacteriales bacterium]